MNGPSPLPAGLRLEMDADTRRLDDYWLWGGSPVRALRLSASGQRAFTELSEGVIRTTPGAILARALVDAGLAHLIPDAPREPLDVTVVIPVRDRTGLLRRCLHALGGRYPVVVVDDGSRQPSAVAAVVRESGAQLLRRTRSAGPGAARNRGLAEVSSELVAFLDSDCVPSANWIDRLAAQFVDPLVVAVAPRVVAESSDSTAGRYAQAAGNLDLGARAARVAAGTRVAYVPTAALLAKRAALVSIARDGLVFDESLRYGEDVDLIWRLHAAGGLIRYDPSIEVQHREPDTWPTYLARRFRYGTSAAPLARRHPDAVRPLVLYPWPALTTVATLAARPTIAAAGLAGGYLATQRSLNRAHVPAVGTALATLRASAQTLAGVARYAVQFASPLVLSAMVCRAGGSTRRRWSRRAVGAVALVAPRLRTWHTARPLMNPAAYVLASIADDMTYGAGVWAGAVRSRDLAAVLPAGRARPVRIDKPTAA